MPISIPQHEIAEFCRRHRVRKLSLFGSVLRDDFRPDSDVDVLVEFEPSAHVTLLGLGGMQMELTELLGREVDLKTAEFMRQDAYERVLNTATTLYEPQ